MSRPLAHRLRFIARAWRPHLGFLIFLAFFTLVSSAVAAAYPLVLKRVIDQVADAVRTGADVPIASALLVLGLIAFGRVVAYQYPAFRAWVNLKIGVTLRERGFSSVLAADHRFRNRFRTGDLITRLTDDIDEYPKIAWFSCSGIFRAVDSGSKVALSVIAMVYLSPGLTALSLLPLPLMLWFVYRVRRQLRTSYVAQQKAISQTNDLLEAAFSGVQIVKAFHTQDQQADRLGEVLSARIEHQFEVQRLFAALHIADALASRAGQVVTLVVGGLMVLSGSLTLGTLYALFVYLDMLVRPLQDLPNLFVTAQQAFGSMDRYEEALESSRLAALPKSQAFEPDPERPPLQTLRVEGLTSGYREDEPILQGVSFTLQRGERLAVVGSVGSGKSTLLKVLAGILPASEGEVHLEDARSQLAFCWSTALAHPPTPAQRDAIGYAPQESLLLSAPIRWNVTFDREREASNLDRALATAQLPGDLARLQNGVDTVLGTRGARISGGQRQRVALARALARDPELLLLDDSTASLDARSEHAFWTSLGEAFPEATAIVTTHRLATVERADRVLFLEDGRVRALGTHEELRKSDEGYRTLLALVD